MPQHSFKTFMYSLSHALFQWSLLYTLTLFFLEDLKPYLISSYFSPHWLVGVVVMSTFGILLLAPYSDIPKKNRIQTISVVDQWIVLLFSCIVGIMFFTLLKEYSLFWSFVGALLIGYCIKESALYLVINQKFPRSKRVIVGSHFTNSSAKKKE